jgi:hypothetical protein
MIFLNTLYNKILEGDKYVKKLDIVRDNGKANFGKLSKNNEYFPEKIREYIENNIKDQYVYKTKINNKKIRLTFYTDKKNKITDEMIHKVFTIIYVLNLYAEKSCSKNLNINIFMTPLKRELPKKSSDILGAINVNGGFSTAGCNDTGEIIIYREEEWFKVLIHELFHNLNLDFSTMNIDKWREILRNKIKIESEFNIYETYCETWARILNVVMYSFIESNGKKEIFYDIFNNKILDEQVFSLIQCIKIINRIKKLKDPEDYRENSNIFCYYIFTAALINDYNGFMRWCRNDIKFANTIKHVDSFLSLILSNYYSEDFHENLIIVGEIKTDKSLRMTTT